MTSKLDYENSSLELADNVSTFYDEVDEFFDESGEDEDYDEEEIEDKYDVKQQESEANELWNNSKESIIEYRSAKAEEEEEHRDSDDVDFSPIKYDLTRFGFEPLKPEERQELITKLKELHNESKVLMIINKFLHKNYINAMRNSTSLANALDKFDETLVFEDNGYQAVLENYAQTRDDIEERRTSLTEELRNLDENHATAKSNFEEVLESLVTREFAVAKKMNPRKINKQAWLDEIKHMLENQRNRIADIAKIRLTYVRLHYQLEKLQVRLREFDYLGPGFSMMDYEFLLKRKKVYTDKRDELRENIRKLADKNLSCVATIKHIDEESDLYNEKVKKESDTLNVLLEKNEREHSKAVELAKTRATIFKNIMKLREEIGLLDNLYLVKKMEMDLREIAKLKKRSKSIQLKMRLDKKQIS